MNQYTLEIVNNWKYLEETKLNRHVSVDWMQVKKIGEARAFDDFEIFPWRSEVHAAGDLAFAGQELLANTVNASFNIFGKPDKKYQVANPANPEKPHTGAFAMHYKIHERFGERIPNAGEILKIFNTPRSTEKFFKGKNRIPLAGLKFVCGRHFAMHLEKKFGGNPLNILEEAMSEDPVSKRRVLRAFNNGRGLVEILASEFGPAYEDANSLDTGESTGNPLKFNFLKRAQLAAVMIHDRAVDSRGVLPLVADIAEVGPVADYELPKALRNGKMLSYSPELAELVDKWKEVGQGSVMEVEIRAATVAVCVKLLETMNNMRPRAMSRLNICHLDLWLWKMGKSLTSCRPHLTRTAAY